jgi:dipeptidyl aminopeptidase/acylaminoacyl peptidase
VIGEDVEDIIQTWSARLELSKANSEKTFAMGASAGCMRLLLAMAEGLRPDCCVLRAPLINLSDWEPNRNGHDAIPGFVGDGSTAWEDLTQADKNRLRARSPMQRTDELPIIPYLIIYGEDDATVPRAWVDAFRDKMEARGAEVQVVVVPGGTHAMAAQAVGVLSTAAEKSRAVMATVAANKFLAKHLA